MSLDNYLKKEKIYASIFIVIGAIALIMGLILNSNRSVFLGIGAGFLPTGIGMVMVYNKAKNNPEMVKKIRLQNEERNMFINMKAAQTSFWISYWIVFIMAMAYNLVDFSIKLGIVFILLFMSMIYFVFLYIFHKMY